MNLDELNLEFGPSALPSPGVIASPKHVSVYINKFATFCTEGPKCVVKFASQCEILSSTEGLCTI